MAQRPLVGPVRDPRDFGMGRIRGRQLVGVLEVMSMWLSDDDCKKIAWMLFRLIKRHLAENGGQKHGPPPRLLTMEQAAEYMGRTKSAGEKLVFRNELPGCVVRRDRRVMIDRVALDSLIDADKVRYGS